MVLKKITDLLIDSLTIPHVQKQSSEEKRAASYLFVIVFGAVGGLFAPMFMDSLESKLSFFVSPIFGAATSYLAMALILKTDITDYHRVYSLALINGLAWPNVLSKVIVSNGVISDKDKQEVVANGDGIEDKFFSLVKLLKSAKYSKTLDPKIASGIKDIAQFKNSPVASGTALLSVAQTAIGTGNGEAAKSALSELYKTSGVDVVPFTTITEGTVKWLYENPEEILTIVLPIITSKKFPPGLTKADVKDLLREYIKFGEKSGNTATVFRGEGYLRHVESIDESES